MNKVITIFILTFLISVASYGQDEVEFYTAIYQKSDSLKRLGYISYIDSSVFLKAIDLDKQHPSKYFETAEVYLKNSEFNEASFLFYLGILRYQYYNAVNPKYKSKDGEDFWVLQFTYIELVETYIHTDVDNFIFILKTTLDYFDIHDFIYYSKAKNLKLYNEQKNSYLNLIDNLEANRIKYTELWQQDRETDEKNIEELKIEWQKIKDNEDKEVKSN